MTEEMYLKKLANSIARKHGCGSASSYKFGLTDGIISHTRYGYRKKSTGQYVPNAYRSKFGWKNTYYQHAETVVQLSFVHKLSYIFLADCS